MDIVKLILGTCYQLLMKDMSNWEKSDFVLILFFPEQILDFSLFKMLTFILAIKYILKFSCIGGFEDFKH